MFVCPKRQLTVSMGTPCDRSTVVACDMVNQTYLEAALSAYIFEYLVAASVTRNGENMTVPSQPLVLLNDTLGNIQKADVRFGVGLLSSCDYPQVAVEECFQAVSGEVLHVRIRQTREHGKDEQVWITKLVLSELPTAM